MPQNLSIMCLLCSKLEGHISFETASMTMVFLHANLLHA